MKKFTLSIICLLSFCNLVAQQQVNTSFKNEMENIFQYLEKNRVPEGILLDFGMEFTNVPAFNGTLTDSTKTTSTILKQIYNTLLTSRVQNVTQGFVTPTQFDSNWRSNRSKDHVALSGLYFKYNRFLENPYPNKINKVNNKPADKYINGVWQNPYREEKTFAIAPPLEHFKNLNLRVKLPQSLFYSNHANEVQNIAIDFNDGLGYRSVTYGSILNVNYSNEGIKTWKYKLTLTDTTVMYAQSDVTVEAGPNVIFPSLSSKEDILNTNCSGLVGAQLQADLAYLGIKGEVKLSIDKIGNNCTITRPLIVAEGFDVGTLLNPENEFGTTNILNFQRTAISPNSDLTPLVTGNSLEIPNDQSYDIIYVDWKNGVDYLQRNAFALEKVIDWVNANKEGSEPNVIIGQSMGGVIARYALTDMENRNIDHDTRLFVSHDAPQQGANVPLSLQFLYRQLTNQYIEAGTTYFGGAILVPFLESNLDSSTYLSILDAPASRQLLNNWSNLSYDLVNTIHDAFYSELESLNTNNGYPQNYGIRNVAISNGSECGTIQNIDPGDHLLNFQYNNGLSFWGDLASLIYNPLGGVIGGLFLDNDFFRAAVLGMVPGSSRYIVDFQAKALSYDNTDNQIYKGLVRYKKKILWIFNSQVTITNVQKDQPAEIALPFDTYGGGFFPIGNVASEVDIPNIELADKFSFISTVSALDIGKGNIVLNDNDYKMEYVGAMPPNAPKNSPFANFIAGFSQNDVNNNNQPHIFFGNRNGNWLAAELEIDQSNPVFPEADCSAFCSEDAISGPEFVCGSETFTIPDVPNTTYNWFVNAGEGASLVTFSQSGNSVTVTQNNPYQSGPITLRCTFNNGECGTAFALKDDIFVGRPQSQSGIQIIGSNGDEPVNGGSQLHLSSTNSTAQQYRWWIVNLNTNCQDQNGFYPPGTRLPRIKTGQNSYGTEFYTTQSHIIVDWGNCRGDYVVNVAAVNTCGRTDIDYQGVHIFDPYNGDPCPEDDLRAYPNPSSDGEITVERIPADPCGQTPTLPNGSGAKGNDSTTTATQNRDGDISNLVEVVNLYGQIIFSETFDSNIFEITGLDNYVGTFIVKVTPLGEPPLTTTLLLE